MNGNEVGVLEVLADSGTFVAALATLVLVYFGLKNLHALRRQIDVGQDAATAARESAEAAAASVRESARARADDQAPRVIAAMEAPEWPPFVDRMRSGMPGGGEPSLLTALGQSAVAGAEPFIFDEQRSWFMWFRTRGVLINEGPGTARVRLDGGSARFVAGRSDLIGDDRDVVPPPRVGAPGAQEYLLRPGDVALFEWAYGHSLADWADASEHQTPSNPRGACFFSITVFDWYEDGSIDYIFVVLEARPIAPVSGRQGHWTLTNSPDDNVGITVYPGRRAYRSESNRPPQPPWQETYREWNEMHGESS